MTPTSNKKYLRYHFRGKRVPKFFSVWWVKTEHFFFSLLKFCTLFETPSWNLLIYLNQKTLFLGILKACFTKKWIWAWIFLWKLDFNLILVPSSLILLLGCSRIMVWMIWTTKGSLRTQSGKICRLISQKDNCLHI